MHPFGLALYRDKVYWTDWDTKKIHSANRHTGEDRTVVRSEMKVLMDVQVFHRDYSDTGNSCTRNNGNCSHLCLTSDVNNNDAPPNRRHRCACPTGLKLLVNYNTYPQCNNNS